jgi:hypothetical protein
MNAISLYISIVVPEPGPLLLQAERGQLHHLLPSYQCQLILADVVARAVADESPAFAAFLDQYAARIQLVKTGVGLHWLQTDQPLTRALATAASAEFLMHHVDQFIGTGPALMILDRSAAAASLSRAPAWFRKKLKRMTLADYLQYIHAET